jgi:hypothetical protein
MSAKKKQKVGSDDGTASGILLSLAKPDGESADAPELSSTTADVLAAYSQDNVSAMIAMQPELFATPAREPVFHGRTFPVGTHLAEGDYVVEVRGKDGYDGAEYKIGTQAQIQGDWVQDDWVGINELFEIYSATLLPPSAPVM